MIIVAGRLSVQNRDEYLSNCEQVIRLARAAPGCLDFSVGADLLEPDRINVYEQWETVADVEAFRGSGPSEAQADAIRDAAVTQFEIASAQRL